MKQPQPKQQPPDVPIEVIHSIAPRWIEAARIMDAYRADQARKAAEKERAQ